MFLEGEGIGRDEMVNFFGLSFFIVFFPSLVPNDLWYHVPCAFCLVLFCFSSFLFLYH